MSLVLLEPNIVLSHIVGSSPAHNKVLAPDCLPARQLNDIKPTSPGLQMRAAHFANPSF
jgi:hypothetical protein